MCFFQNCTCSILWNYFINPLKGYVLDSSGFPCKILFRLEARMVLFSKHAGREVMCWKMNEGLGVKMQLSGQKAVIHTTFITRRFMMIRAEQYDHPHALTAARDRVSVRPLEWTVRGRGRANTNHGAPLLQSSLFISHTKQLWNIVNSEWV